MLSKSPGLESYLAVGMYGTNSPNAYSGIFGTAGSSTKWRWDGAMDHNTYAVRLGDLSATNQLLSATYKVYVGDASGNEILNGDGSSASTIETWTWQGPATWFPPAVTIRTTLNEVVVEWPGTSVHYVLVTKQTLDLPSWTEVTNTPVAIDGKMIIPVDPVSSQGYFRTRWAP